MNHKKPTPVIGEEGKKICPVCGKRAYSRAGIHPQCAVQQADAPREKKLKQAKAQTAKNKSKANKAAPRSWTKKKCPKCGAEMHVRKKVCECGYAVEGTRK